MGAWIEINSFCMDPEYLDVAPFMGAWIEIMSDILTKIEIVCRTLYGCVD